MKRVKSEMKCGAKNDAIKAPYVLWRGVGVQVKNEMKVDRIQIVFSIPNHFQICWGVNPLAWYGWRVLECGVPIYVPCEMGPTGVALEDGK